MSYGFRAINSSGIVNIDEDSYSYVYLGKVAITTSDVVINCVGYPLVFMSIPYNHVNPGGENNNGNFYDLRNRSALAVTRIRQDPSNSNRWIATVKGNVQGGPTLYLRVFGKLHLNFPNGAGQSYGARAWNAQGQLIFDTGCRQLRLAGNSYDTELVVTSRFPFENGEPASVGDSSVTLPFDLANKSIMANTRGTMIVPYNTGQYIDSDTGQTVLYYSIMHIETGFWASGNTLYSRKGLGSEEFIESTSQISVTTQVNNIYTRVAVIDNNLFP